MSTTLSENVHDGICQNRGAGSTGGPGTIRANEFVLKSRSGNHDSSLIQQQQPERKHGYAVDELYVMLEG